MKARKHYFTGTSVFLNQIVNYICPLLCLKYKEIITPARAAENQQAKTRSRAGVIVLPQSVHTQRREAHGNVGNYSYSKICVLGDPKAISHGQMKY